MVLWGRPALSPSSVIERAEVLLAKMVSAEQWVAASCNTRTLISIFSGTASMMRSTSANSSHSRVGVTRSIRLAISPADILPLVYPPLIDSADMRHALVQHRLVDVFQDHRQAGETDYLGDLAPHGPCPQYACFKDKHRFAPLSALRD